MVVGRRRRHNDVDLQRSFDLACASPVCTRVYPLHCVCVCVCVTCKQCRKDLGSDWHLFSEERLHLLVLILCQLLNKPLPADDEDEDLAEDVEVNPNLVLPQPILRAIAETQRQITGQK